MSNPLAQFKADQFRADMQKALDSNADGTLSTAEQIKFFKQVVKTIPEMIDSPEMGKIDDRGEKLLLKTPEQVQQLFPQMVKDFGLKLKVEEIPIEQARAMAPVYNEAVRDAIAHRK